MIQQILNEEILHAEGYMNIGISDIESVSKSVGEFDALRVECRREEMTSTLSRTINKLYAEKGFQELSCVILVKIKSSYSFTFDEMCDLESILTDEQTFSMIRWGFGFESSMEADSARLVVFYGISPKKKELEISEEYVDSE